MSKTISPDGEDLSRRVLLAAAPALAASVMAGAASAADDSPPAPSLEFALEMRITLGASQTPGATPYGKRNLVPITSGRVEGPNIRGVVLPGGGDWQLTRADGVTILGADYMIEAEDGALIHVFNRGVVAAAPGGTRYLRSSPIFEAPIGPHDWLNKAVFVANITPAPEPDGGHGVRIRVYKVT